MDSAERLHAFRGEETGGGSLDGMKNDLIGTVLDGTYRIVRPLGTGGMGAVYEGLDIKLDRRVAVKVIKPELTAIADLGKEFCERFKREAQAAAKVSHPNVVAVHHFDVTNDGIAYLVMEYVEGETLAAVMRRHRRGLPRHEVAVIASQILCGLYAVHSAGVVHRDLKPANIVLRRDQTGRLRATIVDFGLGKIVESGGQTLTSVGAPLGTPRYMSPEQCYGNPVDERSDIYAVGIMLYEMLTGERPFDGISAIGIMNQQTSKPLPPLGPDVPKEIAEVVMQATMKRSCDRFRDARTMLFALRKAASRGQERKGMPKLVIPALACVMLAALGLFALNLGILPGSGRDARPSVAEEKSGESPEAVMHTAEVRAPDAPKPSAAEESLPETRDPEELYRLAERYSMRGKTDLMAEAYRRFLRVCRSSKSSACRTKIRFAKKRLGDVDREPR